MNYVPHNCRLVHTRTGIAIGCAFTPRPMPMTLDAETTQAALLEPRTLRRQSALRRLLGFLWARA